MSTRLEKLKAKRAEKNEKELKFRAQALEQTLDVAIERLQVTLERRQEALFRKLDERMQRHLERFCEAIELRERWETQWWSIGRVAELFGVSVETVKRYLERGKSGNHTLRTSCERFGHIYLLESEVMYYYRYGDTRDVMRGSRTMNQKRIDERYKLSDEIRKLSADEVYRWLLCYISPKQISEHERSIRHMYPLHALLNELTQSGTASCPDGVRRIPVAAGQAVSSSDSLAQAL